MYEVSIPQISLIFHVVQSTSGHVTGSKQQMPFLVPVHLMHCNNFLPCSSGSTHSYSLCVRNNAVVEGRHVFWKGGGYKSCYVDRFGHLSWHPHQSLPQLSVPILFRGSHRGFCHESSRHLNMSMFFFIKEKKNVHSAWEKHSVKRYDFCHPFVQASSNCN